MFSKKDFGCRLRTVRKPTKESQADLADFLGVTPTQVSDMENGKVATTLEKLTMICDHYHVSSDYLLGITDDPTWRGEA